MGGSPTEPSEKAVGFRDILTLRLTGYVWGAVKDDIKVLGLSNWREGRHGVTQAGKPAGGTDLEGKIRVQFWT